MKRIDDKIKEIEKKDKTNRLMFYGIIVLIIAFIIYANTTQNIIGEQESTIAEQLETIKGQLVTEKKLSKQLDDSIQELNRSLKPKEYWNHIKDENSVEGYIEYFTNIWGIHRDSIDLNTARTNIKLPLSKPNKIGLIGFEGWVYIGKETANGPFVPHDDGQVSKIVWRRGLEEENQLSSIENGKPKKDDIIKLVRKINRTTYEDASFTSGDKDEGWRPSSKAYVLDIKKNQIEVWVKIRYY
jgi:hypothetical protein